MCYMNRVEKNLLSMRVSGDVIYGIGARLDFLSLCVWNLNNKLIFKRLKISSGSQKIRRSKNRSLSLLDKERGSGGDKERKMKREKATMQKWECSVP